MSKKKKCALLIALALGILLLLLPSASREAGEGEADGLKEYKASLEEELSELCSSVAGAGRCRVRVSFSEGERVEYKGSAVIGKTPPKIMGITVLAKGGDSDKVRSDITELLSALYGLGKNRICVLKLSS